MVIDLNKFVELEDDERGMVMDYIQLLQNNDVEGLKKYLKKHKINEKIKGKSLLHWAAHMNNEEFSRLLISQGADVNEKDSFSRTPLSTSCYSGLYEMTKLLLQNGAIIDMACMEWAYNGWDGSVQSEILQLLQEHGWINLYLDDLRSIPVGFIGARTVEEALSIMEKNKIHMLSLDHDLGMDSDGNLLKTGYDLVKYICESGVRPANKVYIHTDNVVGRENMYQTLLAAQKRGFIDDDIEIYHYSITENKYENLAGR